MSEYMNQEHISLFKEKLQTMDQDLTSELASIMEQLSESAVKEADANDAASSHEQMASAFATQNRSEHMLRMVRAALRRIDTQDYGYCDCGEEIGIERLKVNPVANQCISCAEITERKQALTGGSRAAYG